MNAFFSPSDGRSEYPQHCFARIDAIEPPDLEAQGPITFSFDAVNRHEAWFEYGQLLSLEGDASAQLALKKFWAARFSGDRGGDDNGEDPYERIRLYHIELSLERSHPWTEPLIGLARNNSWLELSLSGAGEQAVDVFDGLFKQPVIAYLSSVPRASAHSGALSMAFDMDTWPDASPTELQTALSQHRHCAIKQLVCFDIGQGSANALLCQCGFPIYYFDVGCGVLRNAKTKPPTVQFCECLTPPVILSHWDNDHWAGAAIDTAMLKLTWIAPRQKLSSKHTAFANKILKAGGRILIVPDGQGFAWRSSHQSFKLQRCNGPTHDRNHYGLALLVEDHASGRSWLLPGDAAYNDIPGLKATTDFAAVIAPHHGADMGAQSIPPTMTLGKYTRLIYSFGPGNAHGRTSVSHPRQAAVNAHQAGLWPHGSWLPSSIGTVTAGAPVLATASNPSTHNGGAAAGWTGAPGLAKHLSSCPKALAVSQT